MSEIKVGSIVELKGDNSLDLTVVHADGDHVTVVYIDGNTVIREHSLPIGAVELSSRFRQSRAVW